nr:MAG TPA: hypothetical protein [Caudoviricetes sp.]
MTRRGLPKLTMLWTNNTYWSFIISIFYFRIIIFEIVLLISSFYSFFSSRFMLARAFRTSPSF